MSLIPVAAPDVPVLWHNTVVDIEPTSQYGLDRDLTSINSTLCYVNSSPEPIDVALMAPSQSETECNVRRQSREKAVQQQAEPLERGHYGPVLEALAAAGQDTGAMERILDRSANHFVATCRLEPGRQVVRFHTRIPIVPSAEGIYEFALAVPMGAGPLAQGVPLSILVLLPNDCPDYCLDVLGCSVETTPGGHVQVYGSSGHPALAGRSAVAWSWLREPFVWLKYRYQH